MKKGKEAKKEKKQTKKVPTAADKKPDQPIKIAPKKKAEAQALAEATEQDQVFSSK